MCICANVSYQLRVVHLDIQVDTSWTFPKSTACLLDLKRTVIQQLLTDSVYKLLTNRHIFPILLWSLFIHLNNIFAGLCRFIHLSSISKLFNYVHLYIAIYCVTTHLKPLTNISWNAEQAQKQHNEQSCEFSIMYSNWCSWYLMPLQ